MGYAPKRELMPQYLRMGLMTIAETLKTRLDLRGWGKDIAAEGEPDPRERLTSDQFKTILEEAGEIMRRERSKPGIGDAQAIHRAWMHVRGYIDFD